MFAPTHKLSVREVTWFACRRAPNEAPPLPLASLLVGSKMDTHPNNPPFPSPTPLRFLLLVTPGFREAGGW